MFVADHAQRGEPSLRASRDGVIESVPPTVDVPELAIAFEDDGEELATRHPRADVSQDVGLVRDDHVRVGVEQRSHQRAAAAGVAQDEEEGLDLAQRAPVAEPARCSPGQERGLGQSRLGWPERRSNSSSPGLAGSRLGGGVLGPPASDGGAGQAMASGLRLRSRTGAVC